MAIEQLNTSIRAVNKSDSIPATKYDAPMPTDRKRVGCRNWKKEFGEWKVGGYKDFPSRKESNKCVAAAYQNDIKVITRKQDGGLIRVWRSE